jgi:PQQ-dependent dehydrogenase (methanol/ethanol family)
VWNPDLRVGDNKWSCAIMARDADSGELRWAYQIVAHDAWDYDEIMENVLVDMDWHGAKRKLLVHPGRVGYVFVIDRETGEVLSANTYQPTNWATSWDLKTGKPVEDATKRTKYGSVTKGICPSSTGAKDVPPSAFSPRTGLLYIPAHNTCMDYEGVEANYIAGTPYLGASVKMYPGPGGYQGELVAWDVAKGQKVWGVKHEKLPMYSGVLATGGDVIFYGTMDGWFKALNAKTGDLLWQFKVGSGVIGQPVAYKGPDGHEYIAVLAGVGGWPGAIVTADLDVRDATAANGWGGALGDLKSATTRGGILYVFSIGGTH